jgi:hypothetical protein
MKTTLDLPDDVAQILRLESARRGGRKQASLSKLVTDAVRMVYTRPCDVGGPQVELREGRVIVHQDKSAPTVDRQAILNALDD